MTKPAHTLPIHAPRARKLAALPAREYPPGHFTEPVRAWAQMQFVSRLVPYLISPKAGRTPTPAEMDARAASGSGWGGGGALALPGTPDQRRPKLGTRAK